MTNPRDDFELDVGMDVLSFDAEAKAYVGAFVITAMDDAGTTFTIAPANDRDNGTVYTYNEPDWVQVGGARDGDTFDLHFGSDQSEAVENGLFHELHQSLGYAVPAFAVGTSRAEKMGLAPGTQLTAAILAGAGTGAGAGAGAGVPPVENMFSVLNLFTNPRDDYGILVGAKVHLHDSETNAFIRESTVTAISGDGFTVTMDGVNYTMSPADDLWRTSTGEVFDLAIF
ncbi:Hypothetical protein POVN_LOCUS30 [uncultured virus]|nr:Hypothetical protein POVN_LOCUS30 [uncultured virus]